MDKSLPRQQPLPTNGTWLPAGKHIRFFFWLMVVMAVAIPVYAAKLAAPLQGALYSAILLLAVCGGLVFVPLGVVFGRWSQFRLGITADYLELIDHQGRQWRTRWAAVRWTDRMVIVAAHAIPLGKGMQTGIFPRKITDDLLKPRLPEDNELTAFQALRCQWRSPEGMLKCYALAAGFVFLLAPAIGFGLIVAVQSGLLNQH